MSKLMNDLRRMIREDGRTTYRLAKESGVIESGLFRFMQGKQSLSVENVEKIAATLGYEVVFKRDEQTSKRKGT